MIFKRVGEGRPYPEHGMTQRDWATLPPRQIRLDQLVTTKDTL
ncbi:MAG: type II toxin-antitoxin system VapB family antitoxin, partial [Nocardioidaceae bacterium]